MYEDKPYWKHGELNRLSAETKIAKTTLSSILHRRIGVSKQRALFLDAMAYEVLRKRISWKEWLFNASSIHPAFFGKPKTK